MSIRAVQNIMDWLIDITLFRKMGDKGATKLKVVLKGLSQFCAFSVTNLMK